MVAPPVSPVQLRKSGLKAGGIENGVAMLDHAGLSNLDRYLERSTTRPGLFGAEEHILPRFDFICLSSGHAPLHSCAFGENLSGGLPGGLIQLRPAGLVFCTMSTVIIYCRCFFCLNYGFVHKSFHFN